MADQPSKSKGVLASDKDKTVAQYSKKERVPLSPQAEKNITEAQKVMAANLITPGKVVITISGDKRWEINDPRVVVKGGK